jgi:hypothetical protein
VSSHYVLYPKTEVKMAAPFSVGDSVRLVGLVSINGAIGTIAGHSDYKSWGRYAVNLQRPAVAVAAHPSGVSISQSNLIMVMECARPGCDQIGTKGCSACGCGLSEK